MNLKAISKTLLIVIVVVVIAIAGVAAYFVLTPSAPPVAGTIDVYVGFEGIKEGADAKLFWIVQPSSATFKVGDRVKIVLHNNNTYPSPHSFAIIGPDGAQIAQISATAGATREVTITLDKPGTYVINCLTFCGAWHTTVGKMQNVPLLTVTG